MDRIGVWYVSAVMGAVFGAVLDAMYLEMHQLALTWGGTGMTSLKLLSRGPLELLQSLSGSGPSPVSNGMLLYGLGAMIFIEAKKNGWGRMVAIVVYAYWNFATIAGLVLLSTQVGAGLFFHEESVGLRRLAVKEPFCFAGFELLLLAWHAAVWAILLRRSAVDVAINIRTESSR